METANGRDRAGLFGLIIFLVFGLVIVLVPSSVWTKLSIIVTRIIPLL